MEYIAQIYNLSEKFFADYPHAKYPEIALKKGRPYSCLLIEYVDDTYICVPFRSNVRHKYAYHFKMSNRSKHSASGLDYTKSILIKDNDYLDFTTTAIVDKDEYNETASHMQQIVEEVFEYILTYKKHINGSEVLHPKEFERRYGRSTLRYFDDLLLE